MMMELSVGGQPAITWDSDEHPGWPPTDENGKLILDVPWKFFNPEARPS